MAGNPKTDYTSHSAKWLHETIECGAARGVYRTTLTYLLSNLNTAVCYMRTAVDKNETSFPARGRGRTGGARLCCVQSGRPVAFLWTVVA